MQGVYQSAPTPAPLDAYLNMEEFVAIVITNIYISAKYKDDRWKTMLNADHTGSKALQAPENTSAGFVAQPGNVQWLAAAAANGNGVPYFLQLARLPEDKVGFNPVRLIWNPPKAKR